ncbi:gluconolactonase [Sphingomonas sp. Leaf17]|uniref:SMP-30/gluconolactonase/LRE family protein n=1 Tax=Sphingomonas sp. Leaf17 TaxID=1735683 RepID=UPI0006F840AC|nr:SMP-30/gluconolactonase/LRE family protein [Sphingomonas sp. Leaf17]KQM64981.1 gluconolactonase [Sphingomonas sp. Leaf17]
MSAPTRRAVLGGLAVLPLADMVRAAAPVAGIERLDPALDAIVAADARVEILTTGYRWAEGPVWNPADKSLLFSDVPANIAYRWSAKTGARPYLSPSGLRGPVPAGIREGGSNGLALDGQGRLVIADSGTRAITRVDLKTRKRTILIDRFEGKRFNSPNDLAIARSGAIYFTDPPYGLADGDMSPLREMAFNGVYRRDADGTVVAIDRSHHRPNGVALSPYERTLYVALSDEARPEVLAYALDARGMPTGVRRFRDMRPQLAAGRPGLPDGIKTDARGTVFATGPGGVHVCSPDGRLLGIIGTGLAVANCCIGEGGRSLFLTSSDRIARVRLR